MEKRSHIIKCIRNFKNIENQVNLDINRIVRNNFQLIKPKVTCVIINDNNDQLISSIKKEIKIFDDYTVTFTPMYCDGYISKLDKTDYKLSCYCVEGKSVKTPSVIKEWILNGSKSGLRFCEN